MERETITKPVAQTGKDVAIATFTDLELFAPSQEFVLLMGNKTCVAMLLYQ